MRYFTVDPEVAGECDVPETRLDRRFHPPVVRRLHYQFDHWLRDVLVESFPCYIVTAEARSVLQSAGVTGLTYDQVTVSASDEFRERHPTWKLPKFEWIKPSDRPGVDDFGLLPSFRLVISERALKILRMFGLNFATVEPYAR